MSESSTNHFGWLMQKQVETGRQHFGFNYQVESSKEIYKNNQWVSKNIEETRISWEHRTGLFEREYHNTLINSVNEAGLVI